MRKEKVKVGAIERDKVNDSHGKAFLDCVESFLTIYTKIRSKVGQYISGIRICVTILSAKLYKNF